MEREDKMRELQQLLARVQQIEQELAQETTHFPPRNYYTAYHVLAGAVLGMLGGAVSLLFNVAGSLLLQMPQHPLRLIQVYLTFPLGERALQMDDGLALAVGCCLYLGTGALLGILGAYAIRLLFASRGWGFRFRPDGGIEQRQMSSLRRYLSLKRRDSARAPLLNRS